MFENIAVSFFLSRPISTLWTCYRVFFSVKEKNSCEILKHLITALLFLNALNNEQSILFGYLILKRLTKAILNFNTTHTENYAYLNIYV